MRNPNDGTPDPNAPPDTPDAPFNNTSSATATRDQVLAFYRQYMPGYTPSEAEIGQKVGHNAADIQREFVAQYGDKPFPTTGPAKPPATTTPPPTGGSTNSLGPSPSGEFQPPDPVWDREAWLHDQPVFNAPTYTKPPEFQEPDYAAALQDPGYLIEASEGERALQQSAAARGVLNGGGTLKDISQWGQNFATTRVNDVRDRARDTYTLNYQTQYSDPYKYAYQSALDAFQGNLNAWQTKGQVGQRADEIQWNQAYTPWNDNWNRRVQIALA